MTTMKLGLVLALALAFVSTAAAKDAREWQTGKVIDVNRETRHLNGPYSQIWDVYVIQIGQYTYVAEEPIFQWSPRSGIVLLTVGSETRVAIEGKNGERYAYL